MSKAKWFKFYPSDFLTGIHNLTGHEIAVYIVVLCELYDNEGMCRRNDATMADRFLCNQTRFTQALDRLIRKRKLQCVEGMLTNKRVSDEIEHRIKVSSAKQVQRAASTQPVPGQYLASARQPKKSNGFNGIGTHVLPYIEIREDKKETTLEVSALQEEALEEKRKRSAAAVEAFLKRQAARERGTKMRGHVG